MRKRTLLALLLSHLAAVAGGFIGGIYVLPILTAPAAPASATLEQAARDSAFAGTFDRDRKDSDALHWGEGEFSIGAATISFMGRLAPGPDYKLYLAPEFVETAADFKRMKPDMVQVGDVRTFGNFLVALRPDIDPGDYSTVVIWCESFGQFITSGRYERKTN